MTSEQRPKGGTARRTLWKRTSEGRPDGAFWECWLYFEWNGGVGGVYSQVMAPPWHPPTYLSQNFYRLWSIYSYYKILAIFPVLYNISLLLIFFIYSSLCLLIPYPCLTPPPFPLPTVNDYFLLYICEFVSVLLYIFICVIFRFHRLVVSNSICLSLLTYFTKDNTLYVHPHCCKWQNFILFTAE